MISSMAEECRDAAVKLPQAISLCVPVGGLAGIFFILPICFTLPPLEDIVNNSGGQALPYIFDSVMGSPGGGLGLIVLVLFVTAFCSISITVAASRATWAFARDDAMPGARWLGKVNSKLGVPLWSLALVTLVQMLLGLINLGSTSAFTAFVSVGVIALNLSYVIPIATSMAKGRTEVAKARFRCPTPVGWIVNSISVIWIFFELVLFSMVGDNNSVMASLDCKTDLTLPKCQPTALPVTATSMNYASVVLVGLGSIALAWYFIHARRSEWPCMHISPCWAQADHFTCSQHTKAHPRPSLRKNAVSALDSCCISCRRIGIVVSCRLTVRAWCERGVSVGA